jgi:hypothetical protein
MQKKRKAGETHEKKLSCVRRLLYKSYSGGLVRRFCQDGYI